MIRVGMFIEDRYELLEKIGSGGMSEVYKAKCHKLNRIVAIKFLKQEYCQDKAFVSNFQSEAQAAASLLHPNIVSVYDVNVFEGRYYIVMEYVNGITLKQYIAQNGRIPVKEATSIAIQVAQGIEAAHAAGIIHRDVKPQNVLISRNGKIKVTDFGIARRTTANTISTDVVGSVHYISPEQARGGVVDERTDIYSFGIVYFEMITGKMPYDGDSTVTIALKHIQETVPPVTDFVPSCPVSVAKIIEKCTQKQPDRRYQKVSSLISDLKTSLNAPNDDFVIMEPEDAENATIVMSEDEVRVIRGDEPRSSAASNQGGYRRRYYQDADRNAAYNDRSGRGGYEDRRARPDDYDDRYSSRRSYGRYDDDDYYDDDYDDYDDERDSKRKFDKVLMICGIVAGVIIIAALVLICMLTFSGGCSVKSKETESQTESESETESETKEKEVPDVVGKKLTAAQNLIEEAGFEVKVEYSSSDDVEENYVISQSPNAGEIYEVGGLITINVSTGSNKVVIADCTGNSYEAVESLLNNAGLVTTVSYQYSDTIASGKVISTSPGAGSEVTIGSEVEIVVSKGPETKTVSVPKLIGATAVSAQSTLYDLNLEVNLTYQPTTNSEDDGIVLGQSIPQGTVVDEGSTVTLTVGEYEEPANAEENGDDDIGED